MEAAGGGGATMEGNLGAALAPLHYTDGEDVDFFFFPFLVLYKCGRLVQFIGTYTMTTSLDPATSMPSKDYLLNLANLTAGKRSGNKLPIVVFYHSGAFTIELVSSPMYQ
uniref:Alpha/beta hydrolase fold-3 domain-containing protein n=1 Tax=Oryza barthii TaxID=65489 RepID=A0A0D3F6R4_9ORYZ